jgi:hypothetical protein
MQGEASMRAVKAFLAQRKGKIAPFRLQAVASAQNSNVAVIVSANASAGTNTVSLSGYSTPLTDGQFVTINGQLLCLTEDQDGANITFEPKLRQNADAGTTAVTALPYAYVHLSQSSVSWRTTPGRLFSVSFDVEEAIVEESAAAPESVDSLFTSTAAAAMSLATTGTFGVTLAESATAVSTFADEHIEGVDDLSDLFANGEVGDWWRFDAANTNSTGVGTAFTTATGIVNGLVLSEADAGGTSPGIVATGGYEAANIDSASERLIYNFGSTIAQPGTIIICLFGNTLATHVILTGSSAAVRWHLANNSTDDIIMFAGTTLDSTINADYGTKVFTAEFNGASSVFRSNGTQTATGNAGTQGTNRITLGALYDGTNTFDGRVYSLLVIDRLLTSTERDRAERLFGSHAGLSW